MHSCPVFGYVLGAFERAGLLLPPTPPPHVSGVDVSAGGVAVEGVDVGRGGGQVCHRVRKQTYFAKTTSFYCFYAVFCDSGTLFVQNLQNFLSFMGGRRAQNELAHESMHLGYLEKTR